MSVVWYSLFVCVCGFFFFFFQAEDGIRDDLVTGVQTCALPIPSLSTCSKVHTNITNLFELSRHDMWGNPVALNSHKIGRASCRERV